MYDTQKTAELLVRRTAEAVKRPSKAERKADLIIRTRQLVRQAASARQNMSESYGTNITNLSDEEYAARIDRIMMRG